MRTVSVASDFFDFSIHFISFFHHLSCHFAVLVNNQSEINCLDKILYGKNSWTHLSLINDGVVINLQSTKVYVFSDSVLCLGKVLQHPESNEAWKNRVSGVRAERSYRNYDGINGESTEFEWNIFPGFTSLKLCDKISDLLSSVGQTPDTFTGRILFMSLFNDISCDKNGNKDECLENASFVKTFAGRFGIGQWSFIGPGSEKRNGILPRIVTRSLGSYCGRNVAGIRRERTSYIPCNDSIVQGSAEEQRTRKAIYTLHCRSRYSWYNLSHYTFWQSAQYLRSSGSYMPGIWGPSR